MKKEHNSIMEEDQRPYSTIGKKLGKQVSDKKEKAKIVKAYDKFESAK